METMNYIHANKLFNNFEEKINSYFDSLNIK